MNNKKKKKKNDSSEKKALIHHDNLGAVLAFFSRPIIPIDRVLRSRALPIAQDNGPRGICQ